jgi:hypothetical protein
MLFSYKRIYFIVDLANINEADFKIVKLPLKVL